MLSSEYIVLSRDNYLRYSVDALMQTICTDTLLCFCDVDTFSSLDELYNELSSASEGIKMKVIVITRNLWLSRVLASLVDLNMNDEFAHWHYSISKSRKTDCSKIIEKIVSIKCHKALTHYERYVVNLLRRANNVSEAANLARQQTKYFQAQTISIARKYNLRNSNELHFVIKQYGL